MGSCLHMINFLFGKTEEMEKMEDFFQDKKNGNKDLDSFFAQQVRIFFTIPAIAGMKLMIISLLSLGGLCIFCHKEENVAWLWGIFFFLLIVAVFVFGYRMHINSGYKYSFPKAKEKFQNFYLNYTDDVLNDEIVKNDKEKVVIKTLFAPTHQYHIWFCSDFLLFCDVGSYEFTFIRYLDILRLEYYKVHTENGSGFNVSDVLEDRHDCIKLYYQINNTKKELRFFAISPFSYSETFRMKGIEVIECVNRLAEK